MPVGPSKFEAPHQQGLTDRAPDWTTGGMGRQSAAQSRRLVVVSLAWGSARGRARSLVGIGWCGDAANPSVSCWLRKRLCHVLNRAGASHIRVE
jgi:hypothetical protein